MAKKKPEVFQCICKLCGKEFFKSRYKISKGEGKYCSKKCHSQSMNGKRKGAWVEIKCHGCSKLFVAPRYRAKRAMFCSIECQKTRFEKKCENCGKIFYNEPNREKIGRGKYCSKKCYYLFKKGKRQTKETIDKRMNSRRQSAINKRIDKICEHCKNKFTVTFKDRDRIYCLPKCSFLSRKGKLSKRKGTVLSDDKKYWTTERQNLLKDNWPTASKEEILRLFPSKKWSALLSEIRQIRVKRNFKIPKRPNSDVAINAWNHEKEIVEKYVQGMSSSEIAKIFNVDCDLILTALRKNNIKVRSNSEALTIYQNKPERRKANSENAKKRLFDSPEALNQLIENGKKSRKRSILTDKGSL